MKNLYLSLVIVLTLPLSSLCQNFSSVESVEYDASENRFFASNGNNIIQINSEGELSFFGNASATHGMEVMDNKLFVLDGNWIRAYDLKTEETLLALNIENSSFLNGLTNDGNNTLYATDFGKKEVLKIEVADLENPIVSTLVANTISTPNGIVFDGDNNRLIFANWGLNAAIKAIDLTDNSVSTILNTGFGNIDGIDEDNDGNFYISTWSPAQIVKYNNDFSAPPEILNTPFLLNSPADICYAKEVDVIGIPHYPNGNDTVDFLDLGSTSASSNLLTNDAKFIAFPNPIGQQTFVQFELENTANIELTIFDSKGVFIKTLLSGKQQAGIHSINFIGHQLTSGMYICSLHIENKIQTIKLIVE